ncbi:unnamed protein product, partial [Amoebophrya sp. A120]
FQQAGHIIRGGDVRLPFILRASGRAQARGSAAPRWRDGASLHTEEPQPQPRELSALVGA